MSNIILSQLVPHLRRMLYILLCIPCVVLIVPLWEKSFQGNQRIKPGVFFLFFVARIKTVEASLDLWSCFFSPDKISTKSL